VLYLAAASDSISCSSPASTPLRRCIFPSASFTFSLFFPLISDQIINRSFATMDSLPLNGKVTRLRFRHQSGVSNSVDNVQGPSALHQFCQQAASHNRSFTKQILQKGVISSERILNRSAHNSELSAFIPNLLEGNPLYSVEAAIVCNYIPVPHFHRYFPSNWAHYSIGTGPRLDCPVPKSIVHDPGSCVLPRFEQ